MKSKPILIILLLLFSNFSWSQESTIDSIQTQNSSITIQPILHSSFVITYNNKTIYIDPYGGADLYLEINSPDIILITDIHGDHLNQNTLDEIDTSKAIFIVPEAVAKKLPKKYNSKVVILNNEQGVHRFDIFIKALAMYNLPEEENSKHPKGRGNGYVLTLDDKRIYISGDTEDIQEMRELKDIDIAFVCMNLPYTMDINQAANAVLEFQPKIVYPFHYRGKGGLSDILAFKNLVNSKNPTIEVRLKNWYPKS